MLMAREMGVQLRTTSGPVLEKPGDLVGLLTSLGPGDMLFIDEIHRLKPALEEFLYPAMEDFRVDVRIAEGPHAQTIPMTLERFTLIGATTRFGLLTPPMRARFGLVERLGFYPPEELEQIVDPLRRDPAGADRSGRGRPKIARRSRGTPRVANRLLRRVRDYAQVRADGRITAAVADAALARLNVDEFGLDDMDARILTTIIEKFGGGPVGLGTVAVAVGEDAGHAGGGLRAVPDPAGLPRAHPARPLRHRARLPALRPHAAGQDRRRSLTADRPLRTADFDYDLPPELVAQEPLADRAASRLLVVLRGDRRETRYVASVVPRPRPSPRDASAAPSAGPICSPATSAPCGDRCWSTRASPAHAR